jgi:hypothetical protein
MPGRRSLSFVLDLSCSGHRPCQRTETSGSGASRDREKGPNRMLAGYWIEDRFQSRLSLTGRKAEMLTYILIIEVL